jgi:lipoyl-dependent peroxiredoxin
MEVHMPVRTSNAVWEGDLKTGKGTVRLGSGAFEGEYSFSSRFENGKGTNPEELIGAAHAGCFSMALSAALGGEGFKPKSIRTTASVHIVSEGGGFVISRIDLDTQAEIPGIEEAKFIQIAQDAKKNCPVSKALAGVNIGLTARLV